MKRLLLALVMVFAPALAYAQVPIPNPVSIIFDSPDHLALDGAGVPIVASYNWVLTQVGATSPFTTVPVAKTLVTGASPTYAIAFSALPSYPVGVSFTGTLIALGPGGASAPSNASVPFTKPDPAPRAPTGVTVK